MPIPQKLNWPMLSRELDTEVRKSFMFLGDQIEYYLQILNRDILTIVSEQVGMEARHETTTRVGFRLEYDRDANLYLYVDNVYVCQWDWRGNWLSTIAFDQVTTALTKTNDRQLFAYDNTNATFDIFHKTEHVISIDTSAVTIDNEYAIITGQSLTDAPSINWIDEDPDATFLSVRDIRVLEIRSSPSKVINLAGAIKIE